MPTWYKRSLRLPEAQEINVQDVLLALTISQIFPVLRMTGKR